MKRSDQTINIHPPKSVCEKCPSHGYCLAEDGKRGYQCKGIPQK